MLSKARKSKEIGKFLNGVMLKKKMKKRNAMSKQDLKSKYDELMDMFVTVELSDESNKRLFLLQFYGASIRELKGR